MSKIATYLSEHLKGEVLTNSSLRAKFSTDKSVLKVTPMVVAFPYNTSDVRKIAHFAWQLAEKGHVLPVTARGNGSSLTGAAIGAGIVMSFPTHMNKILEVDTKQKLVRVQPGVTIKTLNDAMQLHGLWWPVKGTHPDNTVGGAIANNLYGQYAGKYGDAAAWVDQLEVVLPNGDIIQTGKISKRDLGKKKGLSTAEGELYRAIDNLIVDKQETITQLGEKAGSAGYNIGAVKDKKGNFNLNSLIIGSQGTLGIVPEMILKLDTYRPQIEVVAVPLTSFDNFEQLLAEVQKEKPSRLEFIDGESITFAKKHFSLSIKELLGEEDSDSEVVGLLVIEFNESAKGKAKKVAKLYDKAGHIVVRSDGDFEAAQEIWQVYDRLDIVLANAEADHKTTAPIIEDVLLDSADINDFITAAQELSQKNRITTLFSAHLDAGVVHARAMVSMGSLTDKQKLPKFMEDYYKLALSLGGSIAGEYGEGRLRVLQAQAQFTTDEQDVLKAVKDAFDAHSIFNPDVKILGEASKDPLTNSNDAFDDTRFSESLSSI